MILLFLYGVVGSDHVPQHQGDVVVDHVHLRPMKVPQHQRQMTFVLQGDVVVNHVHLRPLKVLPLMSQGDVELFLQQT